MLLAINANNTNVKFAVFDGETIVGEWTFFFEKRPLGRMPPPQELSQHYGYYHIYK